MKKSHPTRMCVACRSRHPQNTLIRLQQKGTEIVTFEGSGRSFYLCHLCANDEKKSRGLAKRYKQDVVAFTAFLGSLLFR